MAKTSPSSSLQITNSFVVNRSEEDISILFLHSYFANLQRYEEQDFEGIYDLEHFLSKEMTIRENTYLYQICSVISKN